MLTNTLQWGVRQSAEVENQMISVERVLALSELQPCRGPTDHRRRPKHKARVAKHFEFRNVSLRYEEQQPLVLKNVSFHITQGEKVRYLYVSCEEISMENINIDGVDIGKLGLHTLRKNISIIPQVQMKEVVQASPDGLDQTVEEGGSNLSVGQRQPACLARAILSHNRILLMDEAITNVDPIADELIQRTIREKFKQCTVLTVAHRLHTVMDSTRVMVLSDGKVKELDAPHSLLQDRASLFSRLVRQADDATAERLHNIAREVKLLW
ncbi:hypothetical protein HAZT_HAZT011139 [Hyalella azteca]|uniref:ABC transporter domain-containing protein n=1 Tax=Hyalella azteca TaxID=294128 RepID=A0A6A0GUY0_HYAAZ|nr:hypothetical protein HAZT_HAZT011139 [Hyalella azteca]